jgi:hypothetical protein
MAEHDEALHLDIMRALGRIEGRLDGFDQRFRELETLYDRVRFLEGWRKWIIGAQAAVVAAVGFAMKVWR